MLLIITFIASIVLFLKKKKSLSLLLFISYLTYGMGLLTGQHNFLGLQYKPIDLAFIYLLVLYIDLHLGHLEKQHTKIPNPVVFLLSFLLFIGLAVYIDLYFNNVLISDIIKTLRNWLILLLVPVTMVHFSEEDLKKTLHYIAIITIPLLILYMSQYFTGVELSPNAHRIVYDTGSAYLRYLNIPTFWLFTLWYWVFKSDLEVKRRILIIGIVVFSTYLSMTRSVIMILAIGFTLAGWFTSNSIISRPKLIIFTLIILLTIPFIPNLSPRINSGVKEISYVISGGIKSPRQEDGNFIFRIMHTIERAKYLSQKTQTAIFGLGFITENNFTEDPFATGLQDLNGKVIQLDTGDTSWSPLIIRYGFVGALLYVSIIISFIRFFLNAREILYGKIGFIFTTCSFLLGFASSEIATPQFFVIPILLSFIVNSQSSDLKDKCA